MTTITESPQEIDNFNDLPWWAGNARLKDISGKLLGLTFHGIFERGVWLASDIR